MRVKLSSRFLAQCAAAAALSIISVGLLAGGWRLLLPLAAVCGALAVVGYVVNSITRGNCDRILIGWVFLFPLGYYYLSYPRTAPIITFDRAVVLVLVACMFVTSRDRTWPISKKLKGAAIAWTVLLLASFISFFKMPEVLQNAPPVLTIGRLIVEVFVLPALLSWYILRQFDLRPHAKLLHVAVCVISLYTVALGIADVVLQRHVLAYDFSGYYWAYDPTDPTEWAFLRPSGPFTTAGSFGLVGLISFFLLGFLWTMIRDRSGRLHRALHIAGLTAAILQPLLTLNRATYLTVVVCALINILWTTGLRRVINLVGIVLVVLIIAGIAILAPGVFKDRSSSNNVFGRVAENEQSWKIFVDHPFIGVGLMNFTSVAESTPRYQSSQYKGVEVVDSPHNNITWIMAEMGVVGAVPYLISQVLLVAAFWCLRKRGERGIAAWRCFLFIFLGYWLPGLTWTGAESGDLNIWFMFALSVVYRYGAEEANTNAIGIIA